MRADEDVQAQECRDVEEECVVDPWGAEVEQAHDRVSRTRVEHVDVSCRGEPAAPCEWIGVVVRHVQEMHHHIRGKCDRSDDEDLLQGPEPTVSVEADGHDGIDDQEIGPHRSMEHEGHAFGVPPLSDLSKGEGAVEVGEGTFGQDGHDRDDEEDDGSSDAHAHLLGNGFVKELRHILYNIIVKSQYNA